MCSVPRDGMITIMALMSFSTYIKHNQGSEYGSQKKIFAFLIPPISILCTGLNLYLLLDLAFRSSDPHLLCKIEFSTENDSQLLV